MYKWIGIALIIAGISMISWSSKKDAIQYMEAV
jgi:drug/metabolite transporter (DMT)-like permease